MAGRLTLEVFETEAGKGDTVVMESAAIEDLRLEAFEQGYKAGWDDAVSANAEEQGRIGADLARNLQSLSFTYHEARGHVLKALGPLLAEIAAKLLPALAAESLTPMIVERLSPLAEARAGVPVTIMVNPGMREAVAHHLSDQISLPVTLVSEATLAEGQAVMRFGESEERIDLDATIEAIRAAVAEYFSHEKEETPHG